MGNLDGFNANEWEPTTSFDPVPAGEYKAIITASELKPTSKGDGQRLAMELQIVDGKFEGRKLFDGLNLKNPNSTAEQIAKGTLSSICRAVGKLTPKDSSELHNIPLIVRVTVEPRNDTGEPGNRVKGYKPIVNGGSQGAGDPAPKTPPSPGKKAPWAK